MHSWLHLAWEPGDPWPGAEIERWVLWTVLPMPCVESATRRELEGPAPRSTGHYCGPSSLCGCDPRRRPDLWKGGACRLIDQHEWELSRALGGYARRWWIIEGAGGGHLYRYSEAERQLARLAGLPDEPPVPGSLAYSEPDARTWGAVVTHDTMTRTGGRLLERSVAELDAADRDAAMALRRRLLDWFGEQSREAVELGGHAWQKELAEHRVASWRLEPDPDYEALEEDFITDVDF